MLLKHNIHTPVVSGIWAQEVLVVKYLAALPVKWMGEISCYAVEILQIFSAAACTWGGKMIQDVKCILEDGLNMLQTEFNFLTVTQM